MPEPYQPGFTLVDAPDALQKDLVQVLVHDALRRHSGKVLVYDSAHAFHPDFFAAMNRSRGRPEAEFAERCLIQRCITPFQWDSLLSKHLDKFLTANTDNVALVIAFPYGRLFATDELADWERIDHLEFSLAHLTQRGGAVPILALTHLDALQGQPELHRRLAAVPRVHITRTKGVWRIDGPPGNVHLALAQPEAPRWGGLHSMGMSQPTVTHQIDAFAAQFSAFRANLSKREQARFDDLVVWARRHGNALNVSEDLDIARRILLVAAIALTDRTVTLAQRDDDQEARHRQLVDQVEARLRAIEDRLGISSEALHDFVPLRRLPQRQLEHHGGLGQVADADVSPESPVPA